MLFRARISSLLYLFHRPILGFFKLAAGRLDGYTIEHSSSLFRSQLGIASRMLVREKILIAMLLVQREFLAT